PPSPLSGMDATLRARGSNVGGDAQRRPLGGAGTAGGPPAGTLPGAPHGQRYVARPFTRPPGQARAVVLLHGLHPHPFSSERVRQPLFATWQVSDSPLVRRLASHADVFAL